MLLLNKFIDVQEFFISVGVSLIILILWGVSFSSNLKPKVATTVDNETNLLSPLGTIKDDLVATVEQIRDGYVSLKYTNPQE